MIEDNGGRDVTLFDEIAKKLNFTTESIDPKAFKIRRTRGSAWKRPKFTFPGILGKIHRRENPFHVYLGDTTQTFSRNSAVEFTYFVLADSGAFITRSPSRVNPPSVVLKPFQATVWLALVVSAVIAVFALLCIVQHAKGFQLAFNTDTGRLEAVFEDSLLSTLGRINESLFRSTFDEGSERIFLEQASSVPFLRSSMIAIGIWMMLCSTVLTPSYRGALLSFFYTPFTEKPMDSLSQLSQALDGNFTLAVTFGSSSYGIISTGDGIYNTIWQKMQKTDWEIYSVGKGLERVANDNRFAVFAGREKLVFERIQRGTSKFHINRDVFFTKYKSIAVRNGSPLRSPIDSVLVRLYDFGLIDKMTLNEYNCITPRKGEFGWKHKCGGNPILGIKGTKCTCCLNRTYESLCMQNRKMIRDL